MTLHSTWRIAPRRVIETSDEATIRLPGRKTVRAWFHSADAHGSLDLTPMLSVFARGDVTRNDPVTARYVDSEPPPPLTH